jgi:transposase
MEEGVSYRTIAKNVGVNYRNVYDWINNYRKSGLDGIRNKRMNAGRKPVISTDKNKEMVQDIILNKSPTHNIWLSQKYMEYQIVGYYISFLTTGNECQVLCRHMEDN